MDGQFGAQVYEQSRQLLQQGKDVNQIAKILCDRDQAGHNYGIGIVLDGQGKAAATSPTLLEYCAAELKNSAAGNYMNSAALMDKLKVAMLTWQRIPEQYWEQFSLALPSDAGTGAVKTALEVALLLNPQARTLGIEELGWPAYKAIAKVSRLAVKEFPIDSIIEGEGLVPIYQAGPMNTSGYVQNADTVLARAKAAAASNTLFVLDRAYSGFEFARLVKTDSYDTIMRKSYERQIQPFLEQSATFAMAISPTKAFVTFALRPCGFLLVYTPDASRNQEMNNALNLAVRSRGSSFEHSITRAFAKALVHDLEQLEKEHYQALARLADAEALWSKLAQGTPIEQYYTEHYAGLFRNLKTRDGGEVAIYNEHIYPVLDNGRCRQNVTGIPDDEALARKHVQVFAEQCY